MNNIVINLSRGDDIRALEKASIREFVQRAADRDSFKGRVLDYGCGQQPYRDIVEKAGGIYEGYDRPDFPGSTVSDPVGGFLQPPWNTILCTQVLQYVDDPFEVLSEFYRWLDGDGGRLVLTWATCWDEIEADDKWRFTATGMKRLLNDAGFAETYIVARGIVKVSGFNFYLGHGAIAWM